MRIHKRLQTEVVVQNAGGEWTNTSNGKVLLLQPTGAGMPNDVDRFPLAWYMPFCLRMVCVGRRGGLEEQRRVGCVCRRGIARPTSLRRDIRSFFSRGDSVDADVRNGEDGVDR